MGLDDLAAKAQEMLNDQRVKDAMRSEQAESVSDRGLDAASGAASAVTGHRFDDRLADVRDRADRAIGNE